MTRQKSFRGSDATDRAALNRFDAIPAFNQLLSMADETYWRAAAQVAFAALDQVNPSVEAR